MCPCVYLCVSMSIYLSAYGYVYGSVSSVYLSVHFHCARAIFRSEQNLWFLDPPDSCFKAFLAPGPKPLPEHLIFITREPFFALDRIFGFWKLQEAVLKHFWPLTQNHCQNALFLLRASHFSLWTEYLAFGGSRKSF